MMIALEEVEIDWKAVQGIFMFLSSVCLEVLEVMTPP